MMLEDQAAHKKQQKQMFFARMKVNINFQCKTKLSKNYQTQRHYILNWAVLQENIFKIRSK